MTKRETHWTRSMVERRLIEAQRVFEQIVRGEAPGRARDVPPHIHTEEDRMEWMRAKHERLKLEGYYDTRTGLLKKAIELDWGRRPPPERERITRAEQAMRWPTLHVPEDRQRVCLACFVVFQVSKRHGFTDAVNTRFSRALQPTVSKAWAYRLKDRALDAIASALSQDGVVWAELDTAA